MVRLTSMTVHSQDTIPCSHHTPNQGCRTRKAVNTWVSRISLNQEIDVHNDCLKRWICGSPRKIDDLRLAASPSRPTSHALVSAGQSKKKKKA